jgi:hypothetical protein
MYKDTSVGVVQSLGKGDDMFNLRIHTVEELCSHLASIQLVYTYSLH